MTLQVTNNIQIIQLSVAYGEEQCTLNVDYSTNMVVLNVSESAQDFQARQDIQTLQGRVEALENDEHLIFNTLPPLPMI